MGADLILYCVPFSAAWTEEQIMRGVELCIEDVSLNAIEELLGDEYEHRIDSVMECADEIYQWDEDPPPSWDELSEDQRLVVGRAFFLGELREAAEEIYMGDRRDVVAMWLPCPHCGKQEPWLFGGGMSWGDTPECGPHMHLIEYLDLAAYIKGPLEHLACAAEAADEQEQG